MSAADLPRVSVCVVSFNAREPLRRFLESLSVVGPGVSLETCVVDNASSDGSADMVAARFPGVRLIRNRRNEGFARAANRAMGASPAPFHLLANPDIVLHAGSVEALLRIMEEDPGIGLLGCGLLDEAGNVLGACGPFPTTATLLLRSVALDKLLKRSEALRERFALEYFSFPETRQAVDCLLGAFLLARRTAVEQVGMLDERFFLYGEDMDWCRRMREAGWKTVHAPEVRVTHAQGKSAATMPYRSAWLFHQAMYKLYGKYHRDRLPLGLRWVIPAGIALKLGLAWGRHLAGLRSGASIYRTVAEPPGPGDEPSR